MFRLVNCKSFLAASTLALAAFAGTAPAATQLSYYDSDTRNNSSSAPDAFTNSAAGDTDGSLKYSTGNTPVPPANKVAVTFYKPDGAGSGTPAGGVLGTLGSLNQLSFDYYLDGSTLAAGDTLAPAVRLKLSPNGTSSATYVDLVWENVYNVGGPSPKNAWQNDVNVLAGTQWWQRSNGANHDGAPDFQPLSAFAGGYTPTFNGPGVTLNANTPIYGVEISLGSGLPNNFTAYVDDLKVGFSGGDSYAANIAVPEPGTLGLLAVAGGALLAGRRRRSVA
jgi:hypothetical protein